MSNTDPQIAFWSVFELCIIVAAVVLIIGYGFSRKEYKRDKDDIRKAIARDADRGVQQARLNMDRRRGQ